MMDENSQSERPVIDWQMVRNALAALAVLAMIWASLIAAGRKLLK
jgi:hypothetical protein